MTEFEERKRKLTEALNKPVKIADDIDEAEKKLEKHIGFKKQKSDFLNNLGLYMATQGKFWPNREVICYSSAPGMGKTTFVRNLADAMGRHCETIPLAGFVKSEEYSILGDDQKPSLVAWAIEKWGSKNPVILLDELEKVEDKNTQKDLIQLFQDYERGEKKFIDKYFQTEIDLGHVTFFATINYLDNLDLKLKEEKAVNVIELPDFTNEEKKDILKMKAKEINSKYPEKEDGIITEKAIVEILHRINELGIRQAERSLYKIEQEYVYTGKDKEFDAAKNPSEWVKKNIFPYQEEFKTTLRHYFLFFFLGLNFVLFASWIFKRFIIKKQPEN